MTTTIPSEGWYANESEKIDNITDGYVATYVTKTQITIINIICC